MTLALLSMPLQLILLATGLAASFLLRRAELWLGPKFGRLVLILGLFRRDIASENIRRCFPEAGPGVRQRLLERNFEHYGNLGYWEMLAAARGMRGMPLTIVTTVLKPEWLHERITAARLSTGVRAAHHPGAAPAVLRTLRRGESVAFMNDQYARPPLGVPVRFFGVEVHALAVVGPMANRTGAAVVPV